MGEEAGKPHVDSSTSAGSADHRLAAAQVEAGHWRELAVRREASLRELKHRPLVRVALRLDREIEPLRRRLRGRTTWLRTHLAKVQLLLWATPTVALRRRRRTQLALEIGQIEPKTLDREVSVLTFEVPLVATTALTPEHTSGVHLICVDADAARAPAAATPTTTHDPLTLALDRAASGVTTGLLCFAPASISAPAPGWLARLAAAVQEDVVAVTPTTLHPERSGWRITEHDLRVRASGFEIEMDESVAPTLVARAAGGRLEVHGDPRSVIGAPLQCLVVDAAAYHAVGGLDPAFDGDAAAADLCTRLRLAGGSVSHVPSAVVFDPRPVESRAALRHPVDPSAVAWRSFVERHGPRALPPRPGGASTALSWVITTAAPSERVAERWGDWHLAQGLAGALRRLGHEVHVQTHDQADSLYARTRDVHLVLHGLASVRRTPGQRHLIWVISHPETVDVAECDDADLVLVASSRFAADLRSRTSTPVEVLLQATDPERFRPVPVDPNHAHPVTVVAKTRDVMRRSVADAIEAGIRPAIYGGGWRDLVAPDLIVADHIDNELLPTVYSSAGVVLNDHWDTMREWGFVSNRIFDVLACGTPVISDDIPEIGETFGSSVVTYRASQELGELVRRITDDPGKARAAAQQGRRLVLEHHTFEHRAQQLSGLLEKHPKRDTGR